MSCGITLLILELPTWMAFPTLAGANIMAFTYSTPFFSFINIQTYINHSFWHSPLNKCQYMKEMEIIKESFLGPSHNQGKFYYV